MNLPVVVYVCTGELYVIYTLWSIASLKRFSYPHIEVLVGKEEEKKQIQKAFPEIPCSIVPFDRQGYPAFSLKPFAILELLDRGGLHTKDRSVVVCDADVIWQLDPRSLFERFSGKAWFHKITAVDPKDYDLKVGEFSDDNIGLKTSLFYKDRYGLKTRPGFRVNAGLFQIPEAQFEPLIREWMGMLLRLPPSEMLMSEAIFSHVLSDRRIIPSSDDVKLFELHGNQTNSFEKTTPPPGEKRGYEVARHYYSDQRNQMIQQVISEKLDHFGLIARFRTIQRKKNLSKCFKYLTHPRKLATKLGSFAQKRA